MMKTTISRGSTNADTLMATNIQCGHIDYRHTAFYSTVEPFTKMQHDNHSFPQNTTGSTVIIYYSKTMVTTVIKEVKMKESLTLFEVYPVLIIVLQG